MRASWAITGIVAVAWLAARDAAAQGLSSPSSGAAVRGSAGSEIDAAPSDPSSPAPTASGAANKGFAWDNRPGLRYGDWFRLDFRLLIEGGVRSTSPDPDAEGASFEWGRRRAGVQGSLLKYFEYEVDYGFEDAFAHGGEWRDVYLNVRPAAYAQVQAGKFKIPFGYERLTGPRSLDFAYRTRVSDALTPGRSVGVMAHGRAFKRVLRYQVGVFQDDGDQPPQLEAADLLPGEAADEQGWSRAGRATVAPLRLTSLPGKYNNLEVGAAYTSTTVPEGRNHLQGRTVFGGDFFDRRYFTRGPRTRLGLEGSWDVGPASMSGEYIVSRDAREGQGVGNEQQPDNDLPEIEGRGWYLAVAFVVTGEKREGGVTPGRPFLQGGYGAIEVAARYERLRFASAGSPDEPPSTSPRAANIVGNGDRAWTVGVTWYLNRWVKARLDYISETLDDPESGPAPDSSTLKTLVLQCQVGF